jgi:hypothetical protein
MGEDKVENLINAIGRRNPAAARYIWCATRYLLQKAKEQ